MKPDIPVFHETLSTYRDRLSAMPMDRLKSSRIVTVTDSGIFVPFFSETLQVTPEGIFSPGKKDVPFEVSVVVYNHLLMYGEDLAREGRWISYRDVRGSGPLSVFFSDNVESRITGSFGKPGSPILSACQSLGGRPVTKDLAYDVAMAFPALPSIPLFLLFNYEEEEFPATCNVLFEDSVERRLDPESLAILAAVFAARLCNEKK
jgi:hypothetical protein